MIVPWLLLGALSAAVPDSDFDSFLDRTKLADYPYRAGGLIPRGKALMLDAQGRAEELRDKAKSKSSPAHAKSMRDLAANYQRAAERLNHLLVTEDRALARKCNGAFEALKKAYAAEPGSERRKRLPGTFRLADACAKDLTVHLDNVEAASERVRELFASENQEQ